MPRRLLLFRHAKSSWDHPGLPDRERPLSGRGRGAAREMGRLIAEEGLLPDLILCSDAVRARETLGIASMHWPPPEVRILPGLYDHMDGDYVRIVREEGGGAQRLMLVGHNPAMQNTALALVAPQGGLGQKFPTAALAVLEFDLADWSGILSGTGRVAGFRRPRR